VRWRNPKKVSSMISPALGGVKASVKTQVTGFRFQALCLCLALAWLWFQLLNHLRVEWTLNEQYHYGWAVPFLALYLLWQSAKGQARSDRRPALAAECLPPSACRFALSALLFAFLCFLYFPTRLIQEANPEWRLVSWALALEVVGITLLLLMAVSAGGNEGNNEAHREPRQIQTIDPRPQTADQSLTSTYHSATSVSSFSNPPSNFQLFPGVRSKAKGLAAFVFPICFILVAVPWPTVIEGPLIRALAGANASVTVETLGLFGVPALRHGNIIEVNTGPVGIDEACSGIRSFQAALMIALFLGQLFRLTLSRRVVCVLAGFALSFVFNVGRTVLLTYVASVKGIAAIRTWHDPAGVAILVGCFLGLWGVAEWLRRGKGLQKETKETKETREAVPNPQSFGPSSLPSVKTPVSGFRFPVSALRFQLFRGPSSRAFGLSLLLWVLCAELAVEGWYRWHEAKLPPPVTWSVSLPQSAPDFQNLPLADRTRQILRFDDAVNAAWTGAEGSRWQAIFLRWNPGRTAVHLARNHTPEVCLSSAGRKVMSQSEIRWFDVPVDSRLESGTKQLTNHPALKLPFRVYQVTDPTGPLHVFYCLWDDRATAQGVETMNLTYANRLAPVLAGRRQSGQRSLEVALWGYAQPAEAERVFRETLPKLVVVE
jgi:exosortase/archaeosortase family protein